MTGFLMLKNNMKTPCKRICVLVNNKLCEGCGRTWEELREWSFYSYKQRDEIMDRLKDFKSKHKSRFY
jgi:predicted Fe-S protein YdhL (DUF1289 family)